MEEVKKKARGAKKWMTRASERVASWLGRKPTETMVLGSDNGERDEVAELLESWCHLNTFAPPEVNDPLGQKSHPPPSTHVRKRAHLENTGIKFPW